ncbi:MAG: hypothetical protein GXZ18_01710 [Synergistaceae bacterium]|nr:hypothetical protein [Synergistaceae bacterium]
MITIIIIKNNNNKISITKNSYNKDLESEDVSENHIKEIVAVVAAIRKRKSQCGIPTSEEIAVIKAAITDYCRSKDIRLTIRPPMTNSLWKMAARLRM